MSAAPLVVPPATLAYWRELIDAYTVASRRAGGFDVQRAAAAQLLGSVESLIKRHDGEQGGGR